jgi:hypothetical protein
MVGDEIIMKVNVKSKDGTKRVGRDSGSRAEL